MTTGQKAGISLLVAVIAFAALAFAGEAGLFAGIEAEFLRPRAKASVDARMDRLAAGGSAWLETLVTRFAAVLGEGAVRDSFLASQDDASIKERERLYAALVDLAPGFAGVRFIDTNGRRVHYSTWPGDALSRDSASVTWRVYGELAQDRPYAELEVADGAAPRVLKTPDGSAFEICLPLYDRFGVYRGTAVHHVFKDGLLAFLARSGDAAPGDAVVPVGVAGYLVGSPPVGREMLAAVAEQAWAADPGTALVPIADAAGFSWLLATRPAGPLGFLGTVTPSTAFEFSPELKAILLVSSFLTAFLVLFLLLNLARDRLATVAWRIKRMQIELLSDFVGRKVDIDLARWARELDTRREEVRLALRKSVGRAAGKRGEKLDELFDRSWDELIEFLGAKKERREDGPALAQIEAMLRKVLESGTVTLRADAVIAARSDVGVRYETGSPVGELQEAAEIEEAEAIDEAEAIEEAEAIDEADAGKEPEDVEELECLDDAEEGSPISAVQGSPDLRADEALAEAGYGADGVSIVEKEALDETLRDAGFGAGAVGELEELVDELDTVAEIESLESLAEFEDEPGRVDASGQAEDSGGLEELAGAGESGDDIEVTVEDPFFDDPEFRSRLEKRSPGKERVRREVMETLEDVEFEVELSPFDLSPLVGYSGDPVIYQDIYGADAGTAERPGPRDSADEEDGEADDSAVQNGEISMLSDELRERFETLQAVERVDDNPTDAIEAPGDTGFYVSAYSRAHSYSAQRQSEELAVYGPNGDEDASPLEDLSSDGGSVIVETDGLFRIDREEAARRAGSGGKDEELSRLVRSVLGGGRR